MVEPLYVGHDGDVSDPESEEDPDESVQQIRTGQNLGRNAFSVCLHLRVEYDP